MDDIQPVARHQHNGQDSNRINFENLSNRPEVLTDLANAPLASIDAPTGGVTIDSEARSAINVIITRLEALGLVNEN